MPGTWTVEIRNEGDWIQAVCRGLTAAKSTAKAREHAILETCLYRVHSSSILKTSLFLESNSRY